MSKLGAFVRLDLTTVKPYFTPKNLLVYAALAVFLSVMNGTGRLTPALSIGLVIGTLFGSYPFALGEKSNMDALYTSLSVARKTVVLGRYLFAIFLNLLSAAFCVALATVGILVAQRLGMEISLVGIQIGEWLPLCAVFLAMQAVQLPLYFKLGYTRAKIVTFASPLLFLATYLGLGTLREKLSAIDTFMTQLSTGALTIPLSLAAIALSLLLSYLISLAFYRKREF